ncbi:MAG: leucine-rich repeat protein, partial [Ruminococcus sp.]|nr:leucine-rich repeat protein [Ruminococcus sp.]
MRVKTILKATSVLLSAVMLVSSAQVGLTAFAAETEETVAVQETAQTTVSPSVQLAAETQEATDEVIQEETTQPETEVQTEAQAQTEAEPEAEPQDDKDEAAVGAEAEDAVGVTSTFNEGNGTLYITGSGDMPNYSYVSDVPWYSKRGLITSVVIEEGVTSIGRYAFYDCERVTSVLIADTVTKIESEAIEKCKALESIYIPDSVTSIGSYAFQGCSSLKNVRMSNSVKSLSYQLFYGCSSLESFEIPDSVTDIGSSVFAGTAITTLTIPNSVTSIGGDKLSGLTNVTVRATIGSYAKLYCDRNGIDFVSTGVWNHEGKCGENVSYFLDSASGVMTISGSGDMMYISQTYYTPWYLYNDYIKSVVFEEGVTSITNYTLNRCKNLESVTIPDTVTSIGYSAFEYSSLESIYIPDSVTSIGSYTFYGCSS